jgi:hypothetical protein
VENLASLFQGWHHKDAGHAAEGIPLLGRVPFVKGGAKVDHWGGAKGYQQRER